VRLMNLLSSYNWGNYQIRKSVSDGKTREFDSALDSSRPARA
jgi:hypothetical protein